MACRLPFERPDPRQPQIPEAATPRPGSRVSVDHLTVTIPPGHTAYRLRNTALTLPGHSEHEEPAAQARFAVPMQDPG